MTASIARFASTRLSKKTRPLRLWANGTVFRSREESDNKLAVEESLQSGVEIFGNDGMAIEIELLYLLLESLKVLGINRTSKPKLLIGHTLLMKMILANIKSEMKDEVYQALINLDIIRINGLKIIEKDRDKLHKVQKIRGNPSQVIDRLKDIYGENRILKSGCPIFFIIL